MNQNVSDTNHYNYVALKDWIINSNETMKIAYTVHYKCTFNPVSVMTKAVVGICRCSQPPLFSYCFYFYDQI